MPDEIRAEGERSVAIGGDASGATIHTGDQIVQHPTPTRDKRERLDWIHEHLKKAVPAYLEEQNQLRRVLADPPRPSEPYKGLNYFDPEDRSIFFGREGVTESLFEQILQPESRLTILHAQSGGGKTSLIRSGLIPKLLEQGHFPLWVALSDYPKDIFELMMGYEAGGPGPDDYGDLSLYAFAIWVKDILKLPPEARMVLFLDQFERLFSGENPQQLSNVKEDLKGCIDRGDSILPLRIVLSIRTDFLGSLDIFRPVLPNVLDQRVMLQPLDKAQALQAIKSPLDDWPAAWEPDAAEVVLDYLAKGDIEPPHLQLICSQLYERAVEAGRERITTADVQEHDLAALHRQYLQNEIGRLPDEELGWTTLKKLVDSSGVARPRTLEEIEGSLGNQVGLVVETLVDRRVLRRQKSWGQTQIVIAHETLAQEIQAHESPEEIRTKAARELISRGLDDWLGYGNLMDQARLRVLDEYQDVLALPILGGSEREEKALELLLRSALVGEHEISYWLDLAQRGRVDVRAILLERLGSEDFQERAATVKGMALAGLAEISTIIETLADPYPQVRAAAIHTLEKLQPSGEWRQHLVHECYVPAGKFIMGDNGEDYPGYKVRRHKVHVEAFYIAKTPVTNAAFKRYSEAAGVPFKEIPDGKEHHPVVYVSWYNARDYAAWAGMRLPTEAEWEKAASWDDQHKKKRKKKRIYPWGDKFGKSRCNTDESGKNDTTPVDFYGEKGASPCGAWDMAGNVWEWTSSLYEPYPYDPDDGREVPLSTKTRVLRGGSFSEVYPVARCACRITINPDYHWKDYGFRVVCGASPSSDS